MTQHPRQILPSGGPAIIDQSGVAVSDSRLKPCEELLERSTVLRGDGFLVRAAALEDIIEAKERAGRPKDGEGLPELAGTPRRGQGLSRSRRILWVATRTVGYSRAAGRRQN